MFAELGLWMPAKDGDARARWLFRRHYSYRPYRDHRNPRLFCGPGEKMVLLTVNCDALFVWRRFIDASGQQGINCAVFRNESPHLASALIREAMTLAWRRWPGERFYTYVDPRKVKSSNPGYCFKMAGWRKCGETKSGLTILETYQELTMKQQLNEETKNPNYPTSVAIAFRRGRGRSKTEHTLTVDIAWVEGADGKPHGTVRVPSNAITLTKLYQGLTKRFRMRVVRPRTEDGFHVITINPVKGWYATPGAAMDAAGVGVPANRETEEEKTEGTAPVGRAA